MSVLRAVPRHYHPACPHEAVHQALATAVEAAAGVGLLAIWLLQLDRLGF